MSILRADIQQLEQALTLLNQVIPEMDNLKSNVNTIADELNSTWDGAASEYFISKLKSHTKPLKDVKSALEYFADYANETRTSMEKLDKILDAIFSNPFEKSSTHTSSSGATHGGGGTNNKAVEQAIDIITKPVQVIQGGVNTVLGGKKK